MAIIMMMMMATMKAMEILTLVNTQETICIVLLPFKTTYNIVILHKQRNHAI